MESFAQFVLSIFVYVTIIVNFCQKQALSYRLLIDIKTRVTRFEPKVGEHDPEGTNPGLFQIIIQYILAR